MAFTKSKTDPALGQKIEEVLKEHGVDTPLRPHNVYNDFSPAERIDVIAKNFAEIMNVLALDLRDDSLHDTPSRVAKMYVQETFYGLDPDNFPKITVVENKFKYDEMLVEKNINVMSCCEHHFVGIVGKATVAYIPGSKVVGLSKLNRVVDYFSRRPQVQERLTAQIYHALCHILETEDVAVVIDADHYCVASRGIEDTGSYTITSKLGGAFKEDPATRSEFMALAQNTRK